MPGTGEETPAGNGGSLEGTGQPDRPDRLSWGAAARSGYPRHGHTCRHVESPRRAFGHHPGHRFAHRPMLGQDLFRDLELLALDPVIVGNDSADEYIGAAG